MRSSPSPLTATLSVTEYDPSIMQDMLYRAVEEWGLTKPESNYYDFWQSILKNPFDRLAALVLATHNDQCIGVGLAHWRPYFSEGCRSVVYMVAAPYRNQGVGDVLKDGMDRVFQQRGLTHQYALVTPENAEIIPFLARCGFTENLHERSFRFCWDGAPYSYIPVPGLTLYPFDRDHFDPKVAGELADFYNRAYSTEHVHPTVTSDLISKLIKTDDAWMVYARDDATGQIAACTECTRFGMFSGIAVLRPWWGTGLAKWITGYSLDEFQKMGIKPLWSMVREKNAASIRLHKSVGSYENGYCRHFISEIPDQDPVAPRTGETAPATCQ